MAPSAILEVWERGAGRTPLERALELAAAASPDTPRGALSDLPIGRRDAVLYALRTRLFGPEMAGLAACPRCDGRIELTVNAADLLAAPAVESEVDLQVADYELRFRPPNSQDLREAAGDGAATAILRRCLIRGECGGVAVAADALPAEVKDAVMEGMAKADPLADVQLALTCPFCEHRWRAGFDIASFLWSEIEAAAARLLYEVHRLASAYGWSEREILGLSAARRQSYLAMVGE